MPKIILARLSHLCSFVCPLCIFGPFPFGEPLFITFFFKNSTTNKKNIKWGQGYEGITFLKRIGQNFCINENFWSKFSSTGWDDVLESENITTLS